MNKKDFLQYILSLADNIGFTCSQQEYLDCALSRTCSFLYNTRDPFQRRLIVHCLFNANLLEFIVSKRGRIVLANVLGCHSNTYFNFQYIETIVNGCIVAKNNHCRYAIFPKSNSVRCIHGEEMTTCTLEELFEPFYNQFK